MGEWLIDLRPVFLRRSTLEQIADAFWQRYRNFGAFQSGAVETAAVPLLAALLLRALQDRCVNGFLFETNNTWH
ncbi:MAG TPA: hypothetical protein VMA30_15045 [Xanthobacteraceae bacterium]|nr:hypothetical protein [Xanthobacteraceae bacterium]